MPHVHVGGRHHKIFPIAGCAFVLLPKNWRSDKYAIVTRAPDGVVSRGVILFQFIGVNWDGFVEKFDTEKRRDVLVAGGEEPCHLYRVVDVFLVLGPVQLSRNWWCRIIVAVLTSLGGMDANQDGHIILDGPLLNQAVQIVQTCDAIDSLVFLLVICLNVFNRHIFLWKNTSRSKNFVFLLVGRVIIVVAENPPPNRHANGIQAVTGYIAN